jgi:hypothetical protein
MSLSMIESFKMIEGTPTQRLVGYMLADAHNDKTGRCDLSVASLVRLTSLCERAVQKSILELECNGNLTRIFRRGTSTQYNLHPRTTCTPALNAPPHVVHPPGACSAPPPPHHVHPTPAPRAPNPEGTGILTGSEPAKKPATKKPKAPKMTDEEWMSSLKSSPEYSGINIDSEFRRASEWVSKKPDRKMSRRFFENWLDRCEKPLTIKPKPKPPESCLGPSSFPKGHSYL